MGGGGGGCKHLLKDSQIVEQKVTDKYKRTTKQSRDINIIGRIFSEPTDSVGLKIISSPYENGPVKHDLTWVNGRVFLFHLRPRSRPEPTTGKNTRRAIVPQLSMNITL